MRIDVEIVPSSQLSFDRLLRRGWSEARRLLKEEVNSIESLIDQLEIERILDLARELFGSLDLVHRSQNYYGSSHFFFALRGSRLSHENHASNYLNRQQQRKTFRHL